METLLLSKSRFLAGIQCPLRLWYLIHEPGLASEPSPFQQALFRTGRRVGELARKRYPGGVLIEEAAFRHEEAIRSTREAVRDRRVPAIFEGAFAFDGVRIRTDILERSGGASWNLVEVKSGTSVKEENIYDLAVQYYVLKGLGFDIERAGILHVNREYLYDGRELDLEAFFVFIDLKGRVARMEEEIGSIIGNLKGFLTRKTPPAIDPSRHCRRPYMCEFFNHCRRSMPDHWVLELSGIGQDRLDELAEEGIVDIRDVPESFDLSELQARIRECVIHGTEYVGPDLGEALEQYEYPIHFLDFETVAPAIPRYADTRPYQTIPFQWSDHVLFEDGTLIHKGYLCARDVYPVEEVARTLLMALGDRGTICTYTIFENQVIAEMAEELDSYRGSLEALLTRCRDLHAEIRRGYYHPLFHGSFSIKKVLPALVPSMSYTHLTIQEGGQAGLEYLRMIDGDTPPEEKEKIRKALIDYCAQDTLAMVMIRRELLKRAGRQKGKAIQQPVLRSKP
ncbi:MAG: DUF2779 domain-containing protein [Deltaproteobacteria bacterium]|nr:DUF2779 domain-containing protein [Deltaproteobacteria bacterium]MBW2123233.1 DUF2779 domain-containing protein [Deltaproteobacteria bacterium]